MPNTTLETLNRQDAKAAKVLEESTPQFALQSLDAPCMRAEIFAGSELEPAQRAGGLPELVLVELGQLEAAARIIGFATQPLEIAHGTPTVAS
jgi:hypothetical protein